MFTVSELRAQAPGEVKKISYPHWSFLKTTHYLSMCFFKNYKLEIASKLNVQTFKNSIKFHLAPLPSDHNF